MRIENLVMEDWLADNQFVKYNLAESGATDLSLGELLDICGEDIENLKPLSLINPDTMGSIELRKEISKCYKKVDVDNVLVTCGMSEALFSFFNVILNPGDEVIAEFPGFQPLYQVPASIGCKIRFLDLLECENYIPEPKKIEKLVTKKTKLIIINNPHNPTGSTADKRKIEEIAEIAREIDAYLLFDEHYKFLPLVEGTDLLPSGFDICKTLHKKVAATGSITKCFGVNGLRVGWLISNPDLLDECRSYKDYLTHVTPPINDYLAMISLKNKNRLIRLKKKSILENLNRLNRFMSKNSNFLEYIPPTGGVVCFPKLKSNGNSKYFCRGLLEKYDLSLLPGFAFDASPYFRLNFGVESKHFGEALELVQTYIEEIQAGAAG